MTRKIMPMFSDEVNEARKGLKIATSEIKKCIIEEQISEQCIDYILEVCGYWTGNTYVGIEKKDKIKDGFQLFFESMMMLLITLKKSGKLTSEGRDAVNNLLYQGPIYRYLGHGISCDYKKPIKLKYSNLYVSWSKYPQNHYLESKLYGKKLWLHGEICNQYYGIDLEKLGVSKGEEAEVVFPTIKECIMEVETYE